MSFFDLEFKCKNDRQFRARILRLAAQQEKVQRDFLKNRNLLPALQEANMALLKACHYNFVLLTPFYFPRMFDGKPMVFTDYPQIWPAFYFTPGMGYSNFRGSRQTGKTQGIKAQMIMLADMIPGYRQLYFTPLSDQLKIFVDGFVTNYNAFRFKNKKSKLRDNLYYKELLSADKKDISTMKFEYLLSSADKIRGTAQDRLIGDEMQNFDPDLMQELDEVIQASTLKSRQFAGTSLTTTTVLEALHTQGSCSTWAVKCTTCNFENIADNSCEYHGPSGVRDVFDIIQPHGPCCMKCGNLLPVEQGYYLHANPAALDILEFSFHAAQVFVPGVVKNKSRWYDIYKKKLSQDRRKFLQENLGIPVEDGEREVSEAQLRDICVLNEPHTFYLNKCQEQRYRIVTSGVDWGGSDHQRTLRSKTSFTVHVVVGVDYNDARNIDILHYDRYSGMAYEEIAGNIIHNHNKYKARALGSDVGGGDFYNNLIGNVLGTSRHFRFRYRGPDEPYIDLPDAESQPNTWNINRTETISDLYGFIRQKRYRTYPWDITSKYLTDILQLYRFLQENIQTGRTYFLYHRHATKADDTLHAINFATVLARLLLGENLFVNEVIYRQFHQQNSGVTVPGSTISFTDNVVRRH